MSLVTPHRDLFQTCTFLWQYLKERITDIQWFLFLTTWVIKSQSPFYTGKNSFEWLHFTVYWTQLRRKVKWTGGSGLDNSDSNKKGSISEYCLFSTPFYNVRFLFSILRLTQRTLILWLNACFSPKSCIFLHFPPFVIFAKSAILSESYTWREDSPLPALRSTLGDQALEKHW